MAFTPRSFSNCLGILVYRVLAQFAMTSSITTTLKCAETEISTCLGADSTTASTTTALWQNDAFTLRTQIRRPEEKPGSEQEPHQIGLNPYIEGMKEEEEDIICINNTFIFFTAS